MEDPALPVDPRLDAGRLLADAAALLGRALTFMAWGTYLNEGAESGIDGDPGALAVTSAVRTLSIGLAILSLGLIDWASMSDRLAGVPSTQP